MSTTSASASLRPDRETLVWAALLVNTELAVTLAYFALAPVSNPDPLYVAIPFVWINVAAWAVRRADVPAVTGRRRLAALGVGVVYFLVLARVGGVLVPAHGGTLVSVHWTLPPGWGPLVDLSAGGYQAHLFPFKVVGYATLAYLVYATVLVASGGALAGVVGLFSCVSCTWPLVGTVVAGVAGSGSALSAAATGASYPLSTVVFVSAVALLSWRPSV